jgi:phosphoribosylformylglycinamidine (FGAM) synthase-like enzyme
LVEMVLRHNVGATISLNNVGVSLISETPGRVVVAVTSAKVEELKQLSDKHSILLTKLGTTGGDALVINEATIPLHELRAAHTETFKKLFG